jgi:hypothetical protein
MAINLFHSCTVLIFITWVAKCFFFGGVSGEFEVSNDGIWRGHWFMGAWVCKVILVSSHPEFYVLHPLKYRKIITWWSSAWPVWYFSVESSDLFQSLRCICGQIHAWMLLFPVDWIISTYLLIPIKTIQRPDFTHSQHGETTGIFK